MTVVSAQVTVIHRVCSHQAANSYSFSFSYSSPVARFLGRFIGSKFLPISSSTYGSEVWGFHLSWLMGSLDVVLKPNSNRIVLLLGNCNRFNLIAAHLVFDQVCNRVYVAQGQMCYIFCFFINGSVIKDNSSLLTSQII